MWTVQDYLNKKEYPVGKGWWQILDELFTKIPNKTLSVLQIKEKFGGLRVYMEGDGDPEIEPLIQKAEEESYKTCEECGMEGYSYLHRGWIITLCKEHHELRLP